MKKIDFKSVSGLLKAFVLLAAAVFLYLVVVRVIRADHRWSLFKGHALGIEDTEVIVEKVKSIAELATVCFEDEDIFKQSKNIVITGTPGVIASAFGKNPMNFELAIVARGTVRAGFNLVKVNAGDITFAGDTVKVTLPKPEILDSIVNPSDVEIIGGDSVWGQKEMASLVQWARHCVTKDALDHGIFLRAETQGKKMVAEVLHALGYPVVEVCVRDR